MLFIYNSRNLLEIEENNISFINILPIKAWEDLDYADSIYEEQYKKIKKNFIKNLSNFDKGALLKIGNLGASYKIISYYKKLDPLQSYQLNKNIDMFSKINNRKDMKLDTSTFQYFLENKKRDKINAIINENNYIKEDFLVTKTIVPRHLWQNKVKIPKKVALKQYFKDLDKEKYTNIKNGLELLYMEHEKNFMRIEKDYGDTNYLINESNILEILTKLNLGKSLTNIYDLNFIENNIHNVNREQNKMALFLYKNEDKNLKDTIVLENNFIKLRDFQGKEIIKKIYEDEYIDIEHNEHNQVKIWKKRLINDLEQSELIIPTINEVYSIEEKVLKHELKYFGLSEIPEIFEEDLAEGVANTLINEKIDEFVLMLDILKYDISTLKKELKSRISSMRTILEFWNPGNTFYDTDETMSRKDAFSSMIEHIEDGKIFLNVKFGFIIKGLNFDKNFNHSLGTKLQELQIKIEEYQYSLKKLLNPFPYTPFLFVQEKQIELELEDIVTMMNFKYGNKYFSGRTDKNLVDLEKIDDACIYLKVNGKIQGLNIFDGPDMFNGLIIASSGSGKSFTTTNIVDGFMNEEKNLTWIIDRGGSYNNYTETKKGINIKINPSNRSNCINPFSFDIYFGLQVYIENYYKIYNKHLEKNELDPNDVFFKKIINFFRLVDGDKIVFLNEEDRLNRIRKLKDKTNSLVYLNYLLEDDLISETNFETTVPPIKIDIYRNIVENMLEINDAKEDIHILSKSIVKVLVKYIMDITKNKIINFLDKNVEFESQINKFKNGDYTKKEIETIDKKIEFFMAENLYLDLEVIKQKIEEELEGKINKNPKIYTEAMYKYIDPNSFGKIFNGKPTLDVTKKLINIDFGEIQDERISNIVLSALLMNFFSVMTNPLFKQSKKLLVCDEAHAILNANSVVGLKSISYLFRTTRKWGAAVLLLSQNISDFKKEAGEVDPTKKNLFDGIFGNSGWVFLLGNEHPKDKLIKGFDLNEKVAEKLITMDKEERLFYIKSQLNSSFVKLIISEIDYWTATTNKDEKNILEVITKITGNSLFSLLLTSKLFGFTFKKDFANISNFVRQKSYTFSKNNENMKNLIKRLKLQQYDLKQDVLEILNEEEFKIFAAIIYVMEERDYKGFVGAPVRKLI